LPNTSSDEALARGTSALPVADGSHASPAYAPKLTVASGRMTDDPLVFAVKDRVSLVLIVLMGATAWLAV
jgi:hypothetical protein